MSTSDHFLLALQAYQEIRQELQQQEEPTLKITTKPLASQSTPDGSLLIGLADDGLPLRLNLYDSQTGPLLVAGDRGCGRTTLLKTLASISADLLDVQFGVLTPFPDEWRGHEALPNCLGIWPAQHQSAGNFLAQISNWAEVLPKTRQVILILVDDLDLISLDSAARHYLRWLLLHGPECQVWPIVAVNPSRMKMPDSLLDQFQTRILGHVRHYNTACVLSGEPPLDLSGLIPGAQFFFTSSHECMRFWLPPTEGVSYECGHALV